ncbi:UDP-glucuronosyltransferase 2C1 [Octopus sinensis]|nr:UDP-glucuronosyltransferase 2C1 [Octopus sinensis]XP_036363371.1 UDP-glucuronosyltransferase 2C1 [Octopus sinensis]
MAALWWKMSSSIVWLFLITANKIVEADNILFLSWPLFSHAQGMAYVAKELSKYSHTCYYPMTEKLAERFKSFEGIKIIPMKNNPRVTYFEKISTQQFSKNFSVTWKMISQEIHAICDSFLLDQEWFQSLKAVNATIAVVDYVFMSNCLAIIPYRLSIPYVFQGISPEHHAITRTPWHASVYPSMLTFYSDQMNFYERMVNHILTVPSYFLTLMGNPAKSVKAYAPEKPEISFENLMHQAALYLSETDVLLEFASPSLPNVKHIGGPATRPAAPLKGDLHKFVEKSNHGIIVVSFGSFLDNFPEKHLEKLEIAFKEIKYDVIWKHSAPKFIASNIFLTKWLPQNDLLGHPKTKLFITHCGNNGQFEALYHGVPMLGFPVFGDQFHNGRRIQVKGYGIPMDIYNYTKDELVSTINELIVNPKYKNKIKQASEIFRSRPETPAARGARYIDHVIKYGGDYLRSTCQTMQLYQFLMLDIYAVFLAVIIVSLCLVKFVIQKCYRCCCVKKKKMD